MQILVVDDSESFGNTVIRRLEQMGHDAALCCDPNEAERHAHAQPPDLLLCDVNMPGIDGLEVTRRIRRSRPDLPIIIISGRAEMDDVVEGLRLGVSDFLQKPFSRVVLRDAVARVTGVRDAPSPPSTSSPSRAEGYAPVKAARLVLDQAAPTPGQPTSGSGARARCSITSRTASSHCRSRDPSCAGSACSRRRTTPTPRPSSRCSSRRWRWVAR